MNQSFGKAYKLCSKIHIDEIFQTGSTLKVYPYIIKYKRLDFDNNSTFRVVVSAPKRTFRKAHERNRIKRVCREAIRKNKMMLEDYLVSEKLQLGMFIIYSAKEELKNDQLDKKTKLMFSKLIDGINADK